MISSSPSLFICILTLNRRHTLRRLLRGSALLPGVLAWQSLSGKSASIHVLDQGSADGTYEWLQAEARRIGPILQPIPLPAGLHNLGCAGGRNYLILPLIARYLPDDNIVVFLDDDVRPTSHFWLCKLVEPIERGFADIAGVDGRVIDAQGMTATADNGSPIDYVSGGWMAVRMKIFNKGLIFDEQFNPNYYEDVDFCLRAWKQGYRLTAVANTGLVHEHEQESPEGVQAIHRVLAASRTKFLDKWGAWLGSRTTYPQFVDQQGSSQ